MITVNTLLLEEIGYSRQWTFTAPQVLLTFYSRNILPEKSGLEYEKGYIVFLYLNKAT